MPGDDVINTTSHAELTVAFRLITEVNSCYGIRDEPEKIILMERMHIFNSATKQMEHILRRSMHPGDRVQNTDALVRLRFATGPGVEGRPNILLWSHYAAIWLRAHIEQPIFPKTVVYRGLRWIPCMDHKPAPI